MRFAHALEYVCFEIHFLLAVLVSIARLVCTSGSLLRGELSYIRPWFPASWSFSFLSTQQLVIYSSNQSSLLKSSVVLQYLLALVVRARSDIPVPTCSPLRHSNISTFRRTSVSLSPPVSLRSFVHPQLRCELSESFVRVDAPTSLPVSFSFA